MKKNRQKALLEVISQHVVSTQEELQSRLIDAGYDVTQATVSRDLRELQIIKVQDKDGAYRYVVDRAAAGGELSRMKEIFRNSVISVHSAMNDVVVKCYSGTAQGACAAVDSLFGDMTIGTLAGDDTIFIVTQDESAAKALAVQLELHKSG